MLTHEELPELPVSPEVERIAALPEVGDRDRKPLIGDQVGEAEAPEAVRNSVSWGPGPRAAQALMLTVRARALTVSPLALGATKWEMIRQAVIPYGRSGVISGAMLGLGRALGETMAVAIILSPADGYFWNVITNQNSNTIAANIALSFPESSGLEVNRLVATGLVLFAITFAVNALARKIAAAGFSGAEG